MEHQHTGAQDESRNSAGLTISKEARIYLTETVKWAKLLAILGFISIGVIVLVVLFAGTILSFAGAGEVDKFGNGVGLGLMLMYVVAGVIYFIPTWYLFQFSQKMKSAILTESNDDLNVALSRHKSFFKFWGVIALIGVTLYSIAILFTIMRLVLS